MEENVIKIVQAFINEGKTSDGEKTNPCHRNLSFDYCYSYFYNNRCHFTEKLQESCSQLWSYLASWGMLRGSSKLLQNNFACFIPLIEHFLFVQFFLKCRTEIGKIVRVFTTHEGSGLANVVNDVKRICVGANVLDNSLAIYGHEVENSKQEVEKWL